MMTVDFDRPISNVLLVTCAWWLLISFIEYLHGESVINSSVTVIYDTE